MKLINFFKKNKKVTRVYPKFVPVYIKELLLPSIYFPIEFKKIGDGVRMVFKFPNNYGVSLIYFPEYCGEENYLEMAMIKFINSKEYNMISDPILTDNEDVLQYEIWEYIEGNMKLISLL